MMSRTRMAAVALLLGALLAGCGTAQLPVALQADRLGAQAGRVGVVMAPLPKIDTSFPGAGCLLCIGFASMSNSTLTTHTRTLGSEDLSKLKDAVAERLRKKGVDAIALPDALNIDTLPAAPAAGPNLAKKDFSALRKRYGIDKLVVLQVNSLGFTRTYSSYVPTSDPKGTLEGLGYMVDLKTNTYDWYLPVNVMKSADGVWDEPPNFPGLTNAYFQALELGQDEFKKPFGN